MFSTADIGILIRDRLEGDSITAFSLGAESVDELGEGEVDFVDVSDPNNLTIHLGNGQTFTVRIFANGGVR